MESAGGKRLRAGNGVEAVAASNGAGIEGLGGERKRRRNRFAESQADSAPPGPSASDDVSSHQAWGRVIHPLPRMTFTRAAQSLLMAIICVNHQPSSDFVTMGGLCYPMMSAISRTPVYQASLPPADPGFNVAVCKASQTMDMRCRRHDAYANLMSTAGPTDCTYCAIVSQG